MHVWNIYCVAIQSLNTLPLAFVLSRKRYIYYYIHPCILHISFIQEWKEMTYFHLQLWKILLLLPVSEIKYLKREYHENNLWFCDKYSVQYSTTSQSREEEKLQFIIVFFSNNIIKNHLSKIIFTLRDL